MTIVSFACPNCGGEGRKDLGAVNAARKAGTKIYCSRACSVEGRRKRTPEMLAEYQRKYREANRERLRQHAKEYRTGRGREAAIASQRASYQRNREKAAQRSADYARKNREAIRARTKKWLKDNPDKADIHGVKANLSASIGVRVADLPMDLVEAKVMHVRVLRALRDMKKER